MRTCVRMTLAVVVTVALTACNARDDGAFVRDIDGAGTPLPWTVTNVESPTD